MSLHFTDDLKKRIDDRFNGMLGATGEEYMLSPDDGVTKGGYYKRMALLMDNMGLLTVEVRIDPDKNTMHYSAEYTGINPARLTTYLQQQGFATHALPFKGLTASLEEFL
ncbi:MAG: hypothetical protein ACE5KK_03615 [Candidatus Brocadiales bacterium]